VCVLCGEFVYRIHWTDRHVEDRVGENRSDYHRYRRRDRLHRVAVTNEVLRFYGLKVQDWSGSKYVLRDEKGRSELVQDLGSLWPVAQKLAGKLLDPLDPTLQAALEETSKEPVNEGRHG
jgi:hypothetical protein